MIEITAYEQKGRSIDFNKSWSKRLLLYASKPGPRTFKVAVWKHTRYILDFDIRAAFENEMKKKLSTATDGLGPTMVVKMTISLQGI